MNSWDCFDTLIARRYVSPGSIWDEVARRINRPDFVEVRRAAVANSDMTYQSIYDNMPGIDRQVEMDVELEHCYPIVENLEQVQAGDYVISDMYLPSDFILKMLQKCGLSCRVRLLVTPKGKKRGTIWQETRKHRIQLHTGDNVKTDYSSPLQAGIPAELYTGCHFTAREQMIHGYQPMLAAWMRYVRLQCPYRDNFRKNIWIDQANSNLPVLALATLLLPDQPIAFTQRDCVFWLPLYEAITGRAGRSLLSSRLVYRKARNNLYYRRYIDKILEGAAVVDINGRGRHIEMFFQDNKPPTYYVAGQTYPWVHRLSNSTGGHSLEKHNCSKQLPLIGWNESGPEFGEQDHPQEVAVIQQQAMDIAIAAAAWFPVQADQRLLDIAVTTMLSPANFTNATVSWALNNRASDDTATGPE